MGNSTFQNCQRGTVFLFFAITVFYFVITTIALIKKAIVGVGASQEQAEKYEDKGEAKPGQEKPKTSVYKHQSGNDSQTNFQTAAARQQSQQIKQDQPAYLKVVKKVRKMQVFFLPILSVVPLNMLTGTSKAFLLINLLFTLAVVILFNVLEVHRKCVEHKCVRVVLENLWLGLVFFMFVNQWGADPVSQPYAIV